MTSEYRSMRAELPAQVVELVDAFRNPVTQIEFLSLLANAERLESVLVAARRGTSAALALIQAEGHLASFTYM